MRVTHGRQAERLVRPRVFGVPDTNQGPLEQLDDRSKNFFAGRPARRRSASVRRLIAGKARPNSVNLPYFGVVANDPPARVIAILLPATRVATRWPGGDRARPG